MKELNTALEERLCLSESFDLVRRVLQAASGSYYFYFVDGMVKDEIMETFGDQLVQIGQYQISGDLTDEEAVEALRHMIETRGRKGRCAYRIRDNRPRKGNTDLEDEMYRCSRKFYDTLIG